MATVSVKKIKKFITPDMKNTGERVQAMEDFDKLIKLDSFCSEVDSLTEGIETRLKDGERMADLEWDIDELQQAYSKLNRPAKAPFKAYAKKYYPRTATKLKWK